MDEEALHPEMPQGLIGCTLQDIGRKLDPQSVCCENIVRWYTQSAFYASFLERYSKLETCWCRRVVICKQKIR